MKKSLFEKILKSITILTLVLIIMLFIPTYIPDLSTEGYNENKFLLRYEIVGCGSLVRTIEKGGEEIYGKVGLCFPKSGVYEVKFTDGSDEPMKHINEAEFFTGGIAEKYTYVVYGEPIGITQGASDCCQPRPAYNETVPLFKVKRWAPTKFNISVFFTIKHYLIILLLLILILINIVLFLIYIILKRKSKLVE